VLLRQQRPDDASPGFCSGHQSKSAPGSIAFGLPDTAGENTISVIVIARPP